jgi:hypothetical protein
MAEYKARAYVSLWGFALIWTSRHGVLGEEHLTTSGLLLSSPGRPLRNSNTEKKPRRVRSDSAAAFCCISGWRREAPACRRAGERLWWWRRGPRRGRSPGWPPRGRWHTSRGTATPSCSSFSCRRRRPPPPVLLQPPPPHYPELPPSS